MLVLTAPAIGSAADPILLRDRLGMAFQSAPSVSSAYSAEAEQFFARVSDPGATRKNLYAAMIDALVAGGIWSKLDALHIYAAADAATALTNLKQSSYGGTAVNSPVLTTDQGYTGGSTKAITTAFNPSTAGGQYARDSASIFGWSLTTGITNGTLVGHGSAHLACVPYRSDGFRYAGINCAEYTSGSTTDGAVFMLVTRTSSTNIDRYINAGAASSVSRASLALDSSNFQMLLDGWWGSFTGLQACAGWGSKLNSTEAAALYNAVHPYMQTVAGVA